MPVKTSTEKKMAILRMINEKKELLFAKFKSGVESMDKNEAWKVILEKAQSLELAGSTRTWDYVRDNLFGQWKCKAMAKRDNSRKTGAAGGKNVQLDETEVYILETIVGNESPISQGLNIGETGRPMANQTASTSASAHAANMIRDEENNHEMQLNVENGISEVQPKKRKLTQKSEYEELSLKKRQLQVELLEVEIYKNKLIALELERKLQITTSHFTQDLVTSEIFEISNYSISGDETS